MGVSRFRATVSVVLAAALAMALLIGCGSSSPASASPPPAAAMTVVIRDIAFNPPTVTIHAGQTVAWKFDDGSIVHNVTGSDWRSADMNSGYFTHTFATPGTFPYNCTIHSGMTGTVVVLPATAATT